MAWSWTSMPADLVELIAERVLASRLRPISRWWTMFLEGHSLHPGHARLRGRVRFVNLSTGAFAAAHLPGIFVGHAALDRRP